MTQSTPPLGGAATTIKDELEKTASLITGARRLMAEGRSVDLSALEDRVRTIADAVQKAPADVQDTYKEHLGVLIEILDALENDLESQHKALEEGLKNIKHREAQGAYEPKDKP